MSLHPMEERPSAFIQVYISYCSNNTLAYEKLRDAILQSKCDPELRIIQYSFKRQISWARVALYGRVEEEDLTKVFGSRQHEFRLESIEFVPPDPVFFGVAESENDASYAEDLCGNGFGEESAVPRSIIRESDFTRRPTSQNDPPSTDQDIGANAVEDQHNWSDGSLTNGVEASSQQVSFPHFVHAHDMDWYDEPSSFARNSQLLRTQSGELERAADEAVIYDLSNQPTRVQEETESVEQQERERESAAERELEEARKQMMEEQIREWNPQPELTYADPISEATDYHSNGPAPPSSSKRTGSSKRRNNHFGGRGSWSEQDDNRHISGPSDFKVGMKNNQFSAENDILRTPTFEINEKYTETELAPHEKQVTPFPEGSSNESKNHASLEQDVESSVPPMRAFDEGSTNKTAPQLFLPVRREKEYGEPPDGLFNGMSLIYNIQSFGDVNAEITKNGAGSQHSSYSSRNGKKISPSPPWHSRLLIARGRFISEMGKLEKELNKTADSTNDYRRDFLIHEIEKRKRRLEVFNEVHEGHMRKLETNPSSATLLTESMMREMERFASGLPVYNIRPDIARILREARVLLVIAETGSGKSTQIPQYLAQDGAVNEPLKVLCTQPRKTAVQTLMMRVAKETLVGIQCGVDDPALGNRSNARITFVTEKRLLDYIQQDRSMAQYGCVLIDEVHERTVSTDMCLGMMKEVLKLRPDMRLVISSATVDPEPILNYFAEFGARKLEIPGRQFPIQIHYEPPRNEYRGISSLTRDYVRRTVEKVVTICQSEANKQPYDEEIFWSDGLETHAAHIMAFLSTPLETLLAEEGLRSRLAQLELGVKVKILSLYGHMTEEDRAEVFAPLEPKYHHKVVFATNVGETSITIPGVRYIVDCGLAKLKKFDAVRRTNVVELDLISKCAAKQRAGRAGRTGPGICYRLYSEELYEEMESTNVPDILLTNLADVVLYMIASGIEDPAKFDFIDKPDVGMLIQAQGLLRSLKAVERLGNVPVLTRLGQEISKLPVEPRLAKMVLDSVEYDLVAETAIVCAGIQVGSLFHRGRKQDFILADQKKLAFCEETGDPMTCLAVFAQYIKTPKARLKQWCSDNYVNLKCMKSVSDLARKICRIVSEQRHINYIAIKEINVAKARSYIPGFFCRSFGRNLAMYSGSPQHGYFDFNEEKYVLIHPSSALKYNDITPDYIVYECSVRTSRDFVMNVCAADPKWLEEIDQGVLEERKKGKLVLYNISFGPTVKRYITTHMDELQREVGVECCRRRSAKDPYRRLEVYVAVKNLPKLESFVEKIAEEKLNEICRKTREIPIMHADYVLHMSGSGAPVEIIMPGEFCSMFVGGVGINWERDEEYRDRLEKFFSRFGKITEFVTFGERLQRTVGHACLIRMENKEVAKLAFTYNSENDCGMDIEPRLGRKFLSRVGNYPSYACRLLIKWWRRPSRGYGQVKLKLSDFKRRLSAFGVISERFAHFAPSMLPEDIVERDSSTTIDDVYKITVQSLPLDMGNKQLREIMGPVLNMYGVEYDDIYVFRKKAYPVEDEAGLEWYSQRIREYIVSVARSAGITLVPILNSAEVGELNSDAYPFEVKVRPPKRDTDVEFTASVQFSAVNLGIRVSDAVAQAMEDGKHLKMGPSDQIHNAVVGRTFHHQMSVSTRLFDAIYGDLKKIYDRIDLNNVDFDYNRGHHRTAFHISGGSINAVNEVKAAVDKVIDGYTFICRNGEKVDGEELPCHQLLSRFGLNYLDDLSHERPIILSVSSSKMEVKIQGSVSNVELVKTEIKRFLRGWWDGDVNLVLSLQPPEYRQGTLKALLSKNEFDLYSLARQLGPGVHLDAKVTRRELQFTGKESEYQRLLAVLREISDQIQLVNAPDTDGKGSTVPECVACLCAADLEHYCLEACGHYVCKSCICMQLKTSIEMREFPVTCVACEKPLTWSDLNGVICGDGDEKYDPEQLQHLADASLACFIERHGNLYKHCTTPDCRGLHPVTKEAALGHCKLCGRVQCTRCGREEHESMTCEEYAKLRVDADESVRKWIREDQKRRQICPNPNCQAVIEKSAGCNHVECKQCRVHFCWICMFTAKKSSEIYAHMDDKHGGSGADMQELIGEMENDPFIREFMMREHPDMIEGFQEQPNWVIPDDLDLMMEEDDNDLVEFPHEVAVPLVDAEDVVPDLVGDSDDADIL